MSGAAGLSEAGPEMRRPFTAPARQFVAPGVDRVRFGGGALDDLAADVGSGGGRRVLVVTSPSVRSGSNIVHRIEGMLGVRHAATWDGTRPHTPFSSVRSAVVHAREVEADFLISVGGGSVIDTTKMVAYAAPRGVTELAEFEPLRRGAPDTTDISHALPHVSVSTTLSGAEFSGFAGITGESGAKHALGAVALSPSLIILDPTAAQDTPEWLWRSTGVRAIDHCIEALCSVTSHPFADALALEALRLLATDLRPAASGDGDLASRARCQVAMWMSSFSLPSVLLGASHAIGHQLGAASGVPHGVCSAVMLPHVMEHNLPSSITPLAKIAAALGDDGSGGAEASARRSADRVRELVTDLGISPRLRDWGVERDDLDRVAHHAMTDAWMPTNPHPITITDVQRMLVNAW